MPIYEFACPRCRRIFSFLSKRIRPRHAPACPQCGSHDLQREVSSFALLKGAHPSTPTPGAPHADPHAQDVPGLDDPRVAQALGKLERDIEHLDENNPRHMAHMLRTMQQALPPESMPKDMEAAIRRLEKGEDPEKVEADMGEALSGWLGDAGTPQRGQGTFAKDPGLYDYH